MLCWSIQNPLENLSSTLPVYSPELVRLSVDASAVSCQRWSKLSLPCSVSAELMMTGSQLFAYLLRVILNFNVLFYRLTNGLC